eukprot:10565984-Heterocapsa_arctica.AAC.1
MGGARRGRLSVLLAVQGVQVEERAASSRVACMQLARRPYASTRKLRDAGHENRRQTPRGRPPVLRQGPRTTSRSAE